MSRLKALIGCTHRITFLAWGGLVWKERSQLHARARAAGQLHHARSS